LTKSLIPKIRPKRFHKYDSRDYFDDDGFGRTGDLAYYDNDGDLFYVDRMKEIIK
jgi:long-subunit acyl-CoA synthetase (AMP-forming)